MSSFLLLFKGIVSQDWEKIQWIPSDRFEEWRVAGAYFFPDLMPFSCLNSKNACFGSFSFDSYSANDKKQSKIILFYWCCTCMIHSSIGMLLPGQRTLEWCYLLDDCRYFFYLSAIGTVTSACLIYRQVSIDYRWGSAAVTHHSQSYCHMRHCQNMFF